MAKKSRELKAQGIDVINLSLGEPDFDTPENIREAAKQAIDQGFTHYTPIAGYDELRSAICRKFKNENNLNYAIENIVVSTGAKQSIANVVLSLVNPGDEVIVPTPYWVSYSQIIKLAKGIPVYLNTSIENDFKFSSDDLRKVISPKTKLLIYSSPCNPTGSIFTLDELKSIAEVVKQYQQLYVISDEIYEHIRFTDHHYSIASFEEIKDRVIVVNGVSKGYAMTGWRIGYIAASKEIASACDKIQGQFTSGTCSIAQKAAIEAVSTQWDKYRYMKDTFLKRRNITLEKMNAIKGLKVNDPKGAFYVFPNVESFYGKQYLQYKIENSTDLCSYLLDEAKISLVPGIAFGNDQCIRLSYAIAEDQLIEALNRMSAALSKLNV
ncbi:MAG TPA: pyridoxal phosphate-dependent aminotransferase [Bacteroidia bacterium]|nr:pyridoxal phosphate-dependent aminotransferase [Bacteroidia bacterium]HNT79738.1 pyridoxal phosphate-dependent aminotransferase [Bacteroidia bacterium]